MVVLAVNQNPPMLLIDYLKNLNQVDKVLLANTLIGVDRNIRNNTPEVYCSLFMGAGSSGKSFLIDAIKIAVQSTLDEHGVSSSPH